MQKSFIDELCRYDIIGFDMDGTLYDEFEFIVQVYRSVAHFISHEIKVEEEYIHRLLCCLWLQHGSSWPNLFQTPYLEHGILPKESSIAECIKLYRKSEFELFLPSRSKVILEALIEAGRTVFLFSDGNAALQRKKIKALGLEKWFDGDCIFISGDFGKEYQKPSVLIKPYIESLRKSGDKVLYIGDRKCDCEFAKHMGYSFKRVICMMPVGDNKDWIEF